MNVQKSKKLDPKFDLNKKSSSDTKVSSLDIVIVAQTMLQSRLFDLLQASRPVILRLGFLVLFLSPNPAIAVDWFAPTYAAVELNALDCKIEGDNFVYNESIDEACYKLAFDKANKLQKVFSDDQKMIIIGYKNLLFIREAKESAVLKRAITGQKTGLGQIKAVALSNDKKWVAVLNEGDKVSEVVIFKSSRNGSVTPQRKIKGDYLYLSTDIEFSPDGSEIFVLHGYNAALYVFGTQMDSRSSKPEQKVQTLRVLQGPRTEIIRPNQLLRINNKIAVVENESHKALVFSLNAKGDVAPEEKITLEEGQRVYYNSTNNKIEVKPAERE